MYSWADGRVPRACGTCWVVSRVLCKRCLLKQPSCPRSRRSRPSLHLRRQRGGEPARARPLLARHQRTLAGEHSFAIHPKAHGRVRWVRGPSFLLVSLGRFSLFLSCCRFSSFLCLASV